MNSTAETQRSLGVIKFDKGSIAINEGQTSIQVGKLTIDEPITLEGIRSAVTITFQITGHYYGWATIRIIKNHLTTEPFSVSSINGYRKGAVIYPGIRVLDYYPLPWSNLKNIYRFDIQFD